VTEARWREALDPKHVAISLSGEPTLYSRLPELIDLFNSKGYTTFLVSNGTSPKMLEKCHPFQMYVSLDAPDKETYMNICRPLGDYWARVQESLRLLGSRRSAIRITLVKGFNNFNPEQYAAILQGSGASFVEIKGYMYLGYSRNRLARENMPEHAEVRSFAEKIAAACDYRLKDENKLSRVVVLERMI
jgi:tRNA wybutosine-synthesizing protein 1